MNFVTCDNYDFFFIFKFKIILYSTIFFFNGFFSNLPTHQNDFFFDNIVSRSDCTKIYLNYIADLSLNKFPFLKKPNYLRDTSIFFDHLDNYYRLYNSQHSLNSWKGRVFNPSYYNDSINYIDQCSSKLRILYSENLLANNYIYQGYEKNKLIEYHENFLRGNKYNNDLRIKSFYEFRLNQILKS